MGFGDYTVGSNSIVRNGMKSSSSIPMMHNDSQSIIVRHKEFLGEVRSSTNFEVQRSFEINPGNSSTFPWLSGVAVRFQEYKIRGLVFHYIPSSGSAVSSTNAALGTVMMQTSYRSTDVPPASKVELLNEYCSNEAVPSESFCHPIECDPKENPFNVQYVRSGVVPQGDSRLLYDLGITHLCVSGQQTVGNVIGDLWCTYEVELKKPLVASNVTSTIQNFFGTVTGSISSINYFNGTVIEAGNIAVTLVDKTITMSKGSVGTWLIALRITGAGTFGPTSMGSSLTLTDATAAPWCLPSTATFNASNTTGTGLGSMFILAGFTVVDPAVEPTITFPVSSWTGTADETQLTITRLG
jgi:hypothetical protein